MTEIKVYAPSGTAVYQWAAGARALPASMRRVRALLARPGYTATVDGRPIDWYDRELAAMHDRVGQGAGMYAAADIEARKSRQRNGTDLQPETLVHCYPVWAALAQSAEG